MKALNPDTYRRVKIADAMFVAIVATMVFGGMAAILAEGVFGSAAAADIEPVPDPISLPPLSCWVPCEVTRIIDGDTIEADVHLPWGVTLRDQTIRASGYDAWETSRRRRSVTVTDEEIAKGRVATEYLTLLLGSGDVYLSPPDNPQFSYGRIEAEIAVQSRGGVFEVSERMRGNGHTRGTP